MGMACRIMHRSCQNLSGNQVLVYCDAMEPNHNYAKSKTKHHPPSQNAALRNGFHGEPTAGLHTRGALKEGRYRGAHPYRWLPAARAALGTLCFSTPHAGAEWRRID